MEKQIREEFEDVNPDMTLQLKELCLKYKLPASTLKEHWQAFKLSNSISALDAKSLRKFSSYLKDEVDPSEMIMEEEEEDFNTPIHRPSDDVLSSYKKRKQPDFKGETTEELNDTLDADYEGATINLDSSYELKGEYRYMRVSPKELEQARYTHYLNVANGLKEKFKTEHRDLSDPSVDTAYYVVNVSKEYEHKLAKDNVVAQVSETWKYLDLSLLEEYNLFCGQVVGVEGICHGDQLRAHTLLDVIEFNRRTDFNSELRKKKTRVAIASGPFVTAGLQLASQFVQFLKKHRNNPVILLGPFLPDYYKEVMHTEKSFDALFNNIRAQIVQLCPQAILIPSLEDVHHHNILPQPSFSSPGSFMFPNPCIFYINDISFAVCTYDSISEVSDDLLAKGDVSDKAGLCMKMLLNQHNFVPQFPTQANIDQQKYNQHLDIHFTPDVLIVSSKMDKFYRIVNGVVCINPAQFIKYNRKQNLTQGGSYCEVTIGEVEIIEDNVANRAKVDMFEIK